MKEVPNTRLLVSLHHSVHTFANLEVFDISKKRQAKKIYSLGEFLEAKSFKAISHIYYSNYHIFLVNGHGDVTYNSRRSILGAISCGSKIAYHLLTVNADASNAQDIVKLSRKSAWHPHYRTRPHNLRSFLQCCFYHTLI